MCGLVGIMHSDGVPFDLKKAFTCMLYVDSIRGAHSTGVMKVLKSGEASIYKRAVAGYLFPELKGYDDLLTGFDIHVLAGHNRFATKGKVNELNAHPFNHGAITLMHNGTLTWSSDLENMNKFDTDSEAICYNMNLASLGDVKDVVAKLCGAFALVWHDSRDNTINFIRNKERELYLATLVDEKKGIVSLAWASEKWMLELTKERSSKDYSIFLLKELDHMKVKIVKDRVCVSNMGTYKDKVLPVTYKGYQWGTTGTAASVTNTAATTTTADKTPAKHSVVLTKSKKGKNKGGPNQPKKDDFILAYAEDFFPLRKCGKGKVVFTTDYGLSAEVYNITEKQYRDEIEDQASTRLKVRCVTWNASAKQHIIYADLLKMEELVKEDLKKELEVEEEDLVGEREDDLDIPELTYKGPHGRLVDRAHFLNLVNDGCASCTSPLDEDDADDIEWWNGWPICGICAPTLFNEEKAK